MNIDDARWHRRLQAADPAERARQLRPLIEARRRRDRAGARADRGRCSRRCYDARLFKLLLPRSFGGEEVRPAHLRRRHRGNRQSRRQHRLVRGAGVRAARWPRPISNPTSRRKSSARAMPCWPGVRSARTRRRPRSTAAIASPAPGSTPAAAATRNGSAAIRPLVDAEGKRLHRRRTAGRPSAPCCFRKSDAVVTRRLAGGGAEGHRQRHLHGHRPVRAGALHLHARIRRRPPRERAALSLHHLSDLRRGFAGVALGIARATLDAFMQIATTKVPMLAIKAAARKCRGAVARSRWPRRNGNRRARS